MVVKYSNHGASGLASVSPGYMKVVYPLNFTVGIAIPALNEEKNIEHVLCRLRNIGYSNILVIDGQSKDGTLKVASKNGAKIVLQDGRGKGQAIRQVLSNAYFDFEVLVLMDADGSMSPEEVPRYVNALLYGADVVKGSRFVAGGGSEDITLMRKIGNAFLTSSVNLLWSAECTDLCYGFAAFNRKAIRKLAPILESNNFEIEAEIFIKAKKLGLRVVEVPSFENKRRNGKSNLNTLKDGLKIFKTIMTETVRI